MEKFLNFLLNLNQSLSFSIKVMDDFFNPTESSDPSSDFLTREKEALGGSFGESSTQQHSTFDKDFSSSASAFPDLNDQGEEDDLNSFVSAPQPIRSSTLTGVSVTNDDEFESFENQYPEVELPSAPVQVSLVSE